jgi:hypothetical protein
MIRLQVSRNLLVIRGFLLALAVLTSVLCWPLMEARSHGAAAIESALGRATLAAPETPATGTALANPGGGVYSVGETLHYSVSWAKFVTAAQITACIVERKQEQNIDSYHVRIQGQTMGLVNALSPSSGNYEAYVDSGTLLPFRAFDNLQTGSRFKQRHYWLEPEKRTAFLTDGSQIAVPDNTFDMASLGYALRNLNVTPGKAATLAMLDNNRLSPMIVEAEGPQSVTTAAGTFDTMRLALKGLDPRGGISDHYRVRLYITADDRCLPVLFTADALIGTVRVELTSYSRPQ